MATPCAPIIIGPLSEWSSSIRVEGCIPGASIAIVSLSRPGIGLLAKGTSSSGAARLALEPGVRLNEKDRLIAMQSFGGEESAPPSDALALPVAPAPKSSAGLPNPTFLSHLWEFGRALQVGGVVPGAIVTIASSSGILGEGTADEGLARINLSSALPAGGSQIVAEAGSPLGFAFTATPPLKTQGVVNTLPVPAGARLPMPSNPQSPDPAGCDPAVLIGGVFDGATVTVTLSRDGIPDARVFDLDQLWFVLAKPLDSAGDRLEVTQSLPRTERIESNPLTIISGAAPTPQPPIVFSPCPGSEWVAVSGLLAGADLELKINGQSFDAGRATGTEANIRVPPMPPGAEIKVKQQRCGLSATTTVTSSPLIALQEPEIGDRPLQCASGVRVVSATPGALLEIRAQRRASPSAPIRTISPQMVVSAPEMIVPVMPALSVGDEIWVAQLTCTPPWTESLRHAVDDIPPLDAPDIIFPPVIGERSLRVSAIAGATVEVFLWVGDGPRAFLGAGPVYPNADRVPIYRPFVPGARVVVLQRLCSHFSQLSQPSEPALPGVRTFELPVGKTLTFPSQSGHDVRCAATGAPAVTMTCRVDGTWSCTANVTNTEPSGICTFTLTFVAKDSLGVVFSKSLDGSVLPPNSGIYTPGGTPAPPTRHVTWPWKPTSPPVQPEFGDIDTWRRLLSAAGNFRFDIAVWAPGPVTPDLLEDQLPPA